MNFPGFVQLKSQPQAPQAASLPTTDHQTGQGFGEILQKSLTAASEKPIRAGDSNAKNQGMLHNRVVTGAKDYRVQEIKPSSTSESVSQPEVANLESKDTSDAGTPSLQEDSAKDEDKKDDSDAQPVPVLISNWILTAPIPPVPQPEEMGEEKEGSSEGDGVAISEVGAEGSESTGNSTGSQANTGAGLEMAPLSPKLPSQDIKDLKFSLPKVVTPSATLPKSETQPAGPTEAKQTPKEGGVEIPKDLVPNVQIQEMISVVDKTKKVTAHVENVEQVPEVTSDQGSIPAEIKVGYMQQKVSVAAKPSGTTAAISEKPMNIEEKQNEIAAPDKKKLPEPSMFSKEAAKTAEKAGSGSKGETLEVRNMSVSHQGAVDRVDLRTTETDSSLQKVQGERMASLTSLMTSEVTVMKQFKPDKLEVVLRPDSQTQILLQLNLKDGRIDGTARCEKGDYMMLSSQWADLQRTMEGQGVRLAPLRESGSDYMAGQNSFQNSSQFNQQRQGNPGASNFEEPRWSPIPAFPKAASIEAAVLEAKNDQLLKMWA